MRNLKALDNLLTKPVLGANDDYLALVGKKQVELYSYEEQIKQMIRKVDEPHRKALSRSLLPESRQD
jgi:hypothetical protein